MRVPLLLLPLAPRRLRARARARRAESPRPRERRGCVRRSHGAVPRGNARVTVRRRDGGSPRRVRRCEGGVRARARRGPARRRRLRPPRGASVRALPRPRRNQWFSRRDQDRARPRERGRRRVHRRFRRVERRVRDQFPRRLHRALPPGARRARVRPDPARALGRRGAVPGVEGLERARVGLRPARDRAGRPVRRRARREGARVLAAAQTRRERVEFSRGEAVGARRAQAHRGARRGLPPHPGAGEGGPERGEGGPGDGAERREGARSARGRVREGRGGFRRVESRRAAAARERRSGRGARQRRTSGRCE